MATAYENRFNSPVLPGHCEHEDSNIAVSITSLTSDGCVLNADDDFAGAIDFLHLTIDGSIEMNGKLTWAQGRRAEMRFFGQVHPAAIEKLFDQANR